MRRYAALVTVAVLSLAATLACSLVTGEKPTPATPEVLPSATLSATATDEATAEPPATAAPPTATPVLGLPVSFGGVAFVIPEGVASGGSGELVPPSTDAANAPEWDLHPAYTEVRLDGYQLVDTFHYARITVYPVAEYIALFPAVQDTVNRLKSLIADPTQEVRSLPLLPAWNAGEMFHAQVAPVSFQGGKGIRYLAEYAQDVHPISNNGIFYSFQGLTDDGATYISAILPVSHPTLLPDTVEMSGEEYEAFIETFESYLQDLVTQLNGADPESFVPSLTALDALVGSIELSQ